MKRIKHYDMDKTKGVYALKTEVYKGYKIKFRKGVGPGRRYIDARIIIGGTEIGDTWGYKKSDTLEKAKFIINKNFTSC